MEEKYVSVRIPVELYKKIEDLMKEKGSGSATDYIIETLGKNLSAELTGAEKISENDEEKIKERLKALGYMD